MSKKKFVSSIISVMSIVVIFMGLASVAYADTTPIKVQLDGEVVDFTDENGNVVNPDIINNRTMVPMRKIFEEFEMNVEWNAEERSITATNDEKKIFLAIGELEATVENIASGNSEKEVITLDSAPVILNNRAMVPVRFVAESIEKKVGWDATERTVIIIDSEKLIKEFEEATPQLKKLIEIETETIESFKTDSTIEGKLVYKDSENSSNNETVNLEGNMEINMNKNKEMEFDLDLEFSGKGTIYEALKESGYEEIKAKLIMTEESTYIMLNVDGEEVWGDMGKDISMEVISELSTVPTSNMTYDAFAEMIDAQLSEIELDTTTYASLKQSIELLKVLFSEENLKITESGSTTTVKFNFDFVQLASAMNSIMDEEIEIPEGTELRVEITEKIKNKKVESNKIVFEMAMDIPESNESLDIECTLDIDYKSTNSDFEIKLPDVEVQPMY